MMIQRDKFIEDFLAPIKAGLLEILPEEGFERDMRETAFIVVKDLEGENV